MDRADFEKQKVVTAPMAIELAAAAKAMVDLIKKVPAEFRPAALAAADELVESLRLAADAAVAALPEDPNEVNARAIQAAAKAMQEFVAHLKATAPIESLLPALAMIASVEGMVDTFASATPVVPHAFTSRLIDEQADLVEEYLNTHALE